MSGRGLGAQGSHLTSFPETLTFRVFTSQARAHSRPSPTPPKGFLDLPEESPTPRPAPPATTVGTQGQACGGTGCQAQASVTHCVFSWEDRPARQAAQDGGGARGGTAPPGVPSPPPLCRPPLLFSPGTPYPPPSTTSTTSSTSSSLLFLPPSPLHSPST